MDVFNYEDEADAINKKAEKTRRERHKLTVGTFGTEIGMKYLKALEDTYVNIPIYVQNSSIEQVAYKQAQADLVKNIRKELDNGR